MAGRGILLWAEEAKGHMCKASVPLTLLKKTTRSPVASVRSTFFLFLPFDVAGLMSRIQSRREPRKVWGGRTDLNF